MKKAHPIGNLGKYAHPPKTNINFAKPVKMQTHAQPKLIHRQHKGRKAG